MIQTLLNPNHVLSDCDNINDIDAQRMAAVLGKHLYGFKKGEEKPIVKVLGLDANDDVRWSASSVPGGGLPPSTPEDEGKVLVVGDDGQPEWADLPTGGDIAYSVDSATQANWNIDTLYASTQFYLSNGGDNGGVEYYLDGQDRKAGYEVLEGHVYQVNFNCNATCASTSNNVWEGSIYITGPQDQNWYFQLDGSQVINTSITGSTIFRCSTDGVLYFNARLNGSYLGSLPTMSLSKVSIVDLTSAIGGSGGGTGPQYRPGTGIEIDDDVISIDPTEAQEKLTAGPNIDIINNVISTEKVVVAAGQNVSVTSSSDPSTRTVTYTVNSSGGSGVQPVQSNWSETDNLSLAYIQNKPQNLVQDADYTHTDNNFTDSDKSKLDNIESGAEVNVQSDWNEINSSSDAYIQNKPNLAAVATSGSYTDLTDQPTIPSGTQLLPPATSADDGKILKVDPNGYPEWAPAQTYSQVQSNWNEADSSAVSYIQNKPNLATVATSGSYADLSNKPTIPAAQVNSDWNASEGVAQILNKPTLATVATSGAYSDLSGKPSLATVATSGSYDDLTNKPSIPAAQVNADWNSSSGVSEILNKPNLATVATSGSYSDLSNKPTIPTVDQAYSSSSTNAQSGTAVAQAISTVNQVPSSTSADENKVLTVDANGDAAWATAQSISQVQSNWMESNTAAVSYIQNKPTVKALIAGTGITITETAQGIVISLT